MAEGSRQIILHGLGGVIRGVALVDDSDYEWLNRRRWFLLARGYAASNIAHPAGGVAKHGMRRGTMIYMHRLILGLEPGDGRQADHINRDRLDNRRSNLRSVTDAENAQNVGCRIDNTSGHRGVYWDKARGGWEVHLTKDHITYHLGRFAEKADAIATAEAWRRLHMPYSPEARDV